MKNCCTPSDCKRPYRAQGSVVFLVSPHRSVAGRLVLDTRMRVGVRTCPRGDGAGLLSQRSPVRATTLLLHRAVVPRGGTLRRALRIWAGRLASRSVSHRLTSAVVPCPMCGDSLAHVPEERIGRTEKPLRPSRGYQDLKKRL